MKKLFKQLPFARKIARALGFGGGARMQLLRTLPKHLVGAEIGVHLGDFSSQILLVTKLRKLFLIDPWKYERGDEYVDALYGGASEKEQEIEERYRSVKTRFTSEIESGRVVMMRRDSESALSEFEDGSLDFVYIDGNHLYEFVKKDLKLSLRKVKPGGYITGDDYSPGGWWKGGVKRAVDEFGWNSDGSLLWINGRQFVLKRKSSRTNG